MQTVRGKKKNNIKLDTNKCSKYVAVYNTVNLSYYRLNL